MLGMDSTLNFALGYVYIQDATAIGLIPNCLHMHHSRWFQDGYIVSVSLQDTANKRQKLTPH
jgi:hypothetical protein